MDAMNGDIAVSIRTVLSPFLLLTSCATLVWGLQNRYSRVVHAIRLLYKRWAGSVEPEERNSVARELQILERRAHRLRNGVVGYYCAMGFFLLSATLLAMALNSNVVLAWPVVLSLLAGLLVVAWTLMNVFLDTLGSFDAIAEELKGTK